MNIFTKFLIVLASIVALIFGATPANAGKPAAASAVTITFDADGTALPTAAAAADWSKNTGITVVAGECTTGIHCVHFKIVDFPCGRGAPIAGCAYGLPDASCQVEVASWIPPHKEWLDDLIVKHEGGHCIFRAGGVSQSFHLPDSPHALMSATQPGTPTRKDATLTNTDRNYTQSLFG